MTSLDVLLFLVWVGLSDAFSNGAPSAPDVGSGVVRRLSEDDLWWSVPAGVYVR